MKGSRSLFISNSKKDIDAFIHKKEYKKAFSLFAFVLERLDSSEKKEFIAYYSKTMTQLGILRA